MSLITKMRKQSAVLWLATGPDAYGATQFATPVQIKCRWEARTVEFLDSTGAKVLSNAVVYVDRNAPVGSVLMLGTLTDAQDVTKPKDNVGAYEVRRFEDLPDLRARKHLLTAYL